MKFLTQLSLDADEKGNSNKEEFDSLYACICINW